MPLLPSVVRADYLAEDCWCVVAALVESGYLSFPLKSPTCMGLAIQWAGLGLGHTFKEIAAFLKLFMEGLNFPPVLVQEVCVNRNLSTGETLVS